MGEFLLIRHIVLAVAVPWAHGQPCPGLEVRFLAWRGWEGGRLVTWHSTPVSPRGEAGRGGAGSCPVSTRDPHRPFTRPHLKARPSSIPAGPRPVGWGTQPQAENGSAPRPAGPRGWGAGPGHAAVIPGGPWAWGQGRRFGGWAGAGRRGGAGGYCIRQPLLFAVEQGPDGPQPSSPAPFTSRGPWCGDVAVLAASGAGPPAQRLPDLERGGGAGARPRCWHCPT